MKLFAVASAIAMLAALAPAGSHAAGAAPRESAGMHSVLSRVRLDAPTVYRGRVVIGPDAVIVTNGHALLIDASTLVVLGQPRIVSFEPRSGRPAGDPGRSAGRITIRAANTTGGASSLNIDNAGEDGMTGAAGAPGAPGGRGGAGEAYYYEPFSIYPCAGGSPGGQGGRGGQGGPGGVGGRGGDGGDVVVDLPKTGRRHIALGALSGGAGGPGGPGGAAGPGGEGGPGAPASRVCPSTKGGPPGPGGAQGPQGPAGLPGRPGRPLDPITAQPQPVAAAR